MITMLRSGSIAQPNRGMIAYPTFAIVYHGGSSDANAGTSERLVWFNQT
jgi:hypothetical protein